MGTPVGTKIAAAAAGLSAIGIVAVLACARAEDRMPPLPLAKYNEVQRKALVELPKPPRQPLAGPFVPLLRSPGLMLTAKSTEVYLRSRTPLPRRVGEMVALVV